MTYKLQTFILCIFMSACLVVSILEHMLVNIFHAAVNDLFLWMCLA